MPSSSSFLRHLSGREAWRSKSKRRSSCDSTNNYSSVEVGSEYKKMEGLSHLYYGNNYDNGGCGVRKRVAVLVDQSSYSKHAMIWALTHVADKVDLLTLLHIIPPPNKASERTSGSDSSSSYLANSLGSLCKACKPQGLVHLAWSTTFLLDCFSAGQ